jgi:Prolipoprotein diacylglyceryl transferase
VNDLLTIEFGLALLALFAVAVFRWGFRHLPGEGWQIALAVPARTPGIDGTTWPAVNITFYGVISSVSYSIALLTYVFLAAAVGQPLLPALIFVASLLAVGIPASKLVAKWVEGLPGHTIGGAVFAVLVAVMPAMWLVQSVTTIFGGPEFQPIVLLAAASSAYALGEAIGRLACLSFGCCYGRPMQSCTSLQKALYSSFTETYRGRFKKIAYAGGLTDQPVIAVQAIASAVLFALFLVAVWMFWKGHFAIAIVVALGGSQLWRAYSEILRADFRGRDGFTLYQAMALFGAVLSVPFAWLYGDASVATKASAAAGWRAVFQPELLIATQCLSIAILVYMGRSTVTSSRLELLLHVPKNTKPSVNAP